MAPLLWVKAETDVDWELMVAYDTDVLVVTIVSGVKVEDGLSLVDSDEAVELVIEDSLEDDGIVEARPHV